MICKRETLHQIIGRNQVGSKLAPLGARTLSLSATGRMVRTVSFAARNGPILERAVRLREGFEHDRAFILLQIVSLARISPRQWLEGPAIHGEQDQAKMTKTTFISCENPIIGYNSSRPRIEYFIWSMELSAKRWCREAATLPNDHMDNLVGVMVQHGTTRASRAF